MPISPNDRDMILRSQQLQNESHDPHRQVGVVIANDRNEIVSTGTNAPPASLGLSHAESYRSIMNDPHWKYYMLEHGERNAIFSALKRGYSVEGTTMYSTLYPCADCARAIVASGISRLVVPKPGINLERDEKWFEHYKYAHKIIEFAGITVDYFNSTDLSEDAETSLGPS